jgi:hypothetical protein
MYSSGVETEFPFSSRVFHIFSTDQVYITSIIGTNTGKKRMAGQSETRHAI